MTQIPENQTIKQVNDNVNESLETCKNCKSTGLPEDVTFCPNCGFPQRGTEAQIKKFKYDEVLLKREMEKSEKAVRTARFILFALSGLNIVVGLIYSFALDYGIESFIAGIIGAIIYFILGIWSKKSPFPAILSGFFIYLVFVAINAIADPNTLYKGILIKVLIIIGFIHGIRGAKEADKVKKEIAARKTTVNLNTENELS